MAGAMVHDCMGMPHEFVHGSAGGGSAGCCAPTPIVGLLPGAASSLNAGSLLATCGLVLKLAAFQPWQP